MEPFDVLYMGNISNFHLDHSNCYLFYFPKFQDPFISPEKNFDYRVHGCAGGAALQAVSECPRCR